MPALYRSVREICSMDHWAGYSAKIPSIGIAKPATLRDADGADQHSARLAPGRRSRHGRVGDLPLDGDLQRLNPRLWRTIGRTRGRRRPLFATKRSGGDT